MGQTLASVLTQTVADLEVLVVDDGSSDGTLHEAARWQRHDSARVRVLGHPGGSNRGVAASRNLALDHARGEFIAFVDADDAWLPHKLERQLQTFVAAPEQVGVVFTDAWNVRIHPSDDWSVGDKWLNPRSAGLSSRFHGEPGSSAEQLLFAPDKEFHNWVMSPTPLVRARYFNEGLRFIGPPRLNTQFEDYLMWLMLAFRCEFLALQEPLAYYRIHESQFVSRYCREARCLHYLEATRELLDILKEECAYEIARRGWQRRIDERFSEVSLALLRHYSPPGHVTIRSVPMADYAPLLRLGLRHGNLLLSCLALSVRLGHAARHRLLSNRVIHRAKRFLRS